MQYILNENKEKKNDQASNKKRFKRKQIKGK